MYCAATNSACSGFCWCGNQQFFPSMQQRKRFFNCFNNAAFSYSVRSPYINKHLVAQVCARQLIFKKNDIAHNAFNNEPLKKIKRQRLMDQIGQNPTVINRSWCWRVQITLRFNTTPKSHVRFKGCQKRWIWGMLADICVIPIFIVVILFTTILSRFLHNFPAVNRDLRDVCHNAFRLTA